MGNLSWNIEKNKQSPSGVLENFAKFIGKRPCWSLFFKITLRTGGLQLYEEETPVQRNSCKFREILKNTSFKENLRNIALGNDPEESFVFCGNSLQNVSFFNQTQALYNLSWCVTHSILATFLRKVSQKVIASQSSCYLAGFLIFPK